MKRIRWFFLTGLLFLPFAFAATDEGLKPKLILNHIKVIRAQELLGDELYFDISVSRANQPRQYLRIPPFPVHWLSSQAEKIKQVTLWSESIKKGQTVILIISLMETDPTPLNPDDLVGSIRVKLKNEQGILQSQWGMSDRLSRPVTIVGREGDIQKFELFDDKGRYEVYLSLKN